MVEFVYPRSGFGRGEVRTELLLVGYDYDFNICLRIEEIWVQGRNHSFPSRFQPGQLPEVIPSSRSDDCIPSISAMLVPDPESASL